MKCWVLELKFFASESTLNEFQQLFIDCDGALLYKIINFDIRDNYSEKNTVQLFAYSLHYFAACFIKQSFIFLNKYEKLQNNLEKTPQTFYYHLY